MTYKILKHTADLRMQIKAFTLEGLFRDAFSGMMDILKKGIPPERKPVQRKISVVSPDRTALLVDFLNEVLYLSQTRKEIYTEINITEFSEEHEARLLAEIKGVKINEFDEDIKAATYHEADVKQNEKGEWETLLVFDI